MVVFHSSSHYKYQSLFILFKIYYEPPIGSLLLKSPTSFDQHLKNKNISNNLHVPPTKLFINTRHYTREVSRLGNVAIFQ